MTATAPFAAVQASINAGCTQLLANALATFNGGEPFAVLFERVPVEVMGEITGYAPRVSLEASYATGLAQGAQLTISGTAYSVTGNVEPDESGWINDLELREA